jgi:hypothetical protein
MVERRLARSGTAIFGCTFDCTICNRYLPTKIVFQRRRIRITPQMMRGQACRKIKQNGNQQNCCLTCYVHAVQVFRNLTFYRWMHNSKFWKFEVNFWGKGETFCCWHSSYKEDCVPFTLWRNFGVAITSNEFILALKSTNSDQICDRRTGGIKGLVLEDVVQI